MRHKLRASYSPISFLLPLLLHQLPFRLHSLAASSIIILSHAGYVPEAPGSNATSQVTPEATLISSLRQLYEENARTRADQNRTTEAILHSLMLSGVIM
jgi:hypothetical protein